jgi:hypothetical protein
VWNKKTEFFADSKFVDMDGEKSYSQKPSKNCNSEKLKLHFLREIFSSPFQRISIRHTVVHFIVPHTTFLGEKKFEAILALFANF